ncbi:MAG: hypothetical protein FJ255_10705 [Phycisphaerae bacterium]|nr:hypothetical protein [Phycisphaerae bacterium]
MKGSGLYAQDVLPIPANMDVRGAGFGPGVAVKLDLAVVGAPYEDFNDLLAFLNHENAVC